MSRVLRLSPASSEALSVYVTDPALVGEPVNAAIAASVVGQSMTIPDGVDPWEWAFAIHQGADSAGEDGDHAWSKALTALASRVARADMLTDAETDRLLVQIHKDLKGTP